MTTDESKTAATLFLDREWRQLRNSCDREAVVRVQGAIDALGAAGVLSDTEHELWLRRIRECPGHDDEGGRKWCAYCGVIRPGDWLDAGALESVGEPSSRALLDALTADPTAHCDACGRAAWAAGDLCGMPQPSGERCAGHFVANAAEHGPVCVCPECARRASMFRGSTGRDRGQLP